MASLSDRRNALDLSQMPAECADGVICSFLVEHLEKPEQLFAVVNHLLKPHGIAFRSASCPRSEPDAGGMRRWRHLQLSGGTPGKARATVRRRQSPSEAPWHRFQIGELPSIGARCRRNAPMASSAAFWWNTWKSPSNCSPSSITF